MAIVGGGPAGLALAAELRRLSIGKVIVLERESRAGGTPRHCGHYPFGLYEYMRLLKGPDYARRNLESAILRGVEVRTDTTVTALQPDGVLEILNGKGRSILRADRVVLCTGVRESSRAQRFIGGDRPRGVVTTGALQSMVYLKGIKPFERPVILGSELVSLSAIQTAAHLGIKPVAIVEEENHLIARSILRPYLTLKSIPLHLSATNPRILGQEKVEALEYTNKDGSRQLIETDGIIISGRFRPEAALLKASHLAVDAGTGGPDIDQFGRCTDPVYYATGNLLRPAETSGYCWREGVETARRIAADLNGSEFGTLSVSVHVADPAIRYVVPQRLTHANGMDGMNRFYISLKEPVNASLAIHGDQGQLWKRRLNARPVRRIEIPMIDPFRNGHTSAIHFSIQR
ncbi:hypothetical protein AB833_02935 [Chromatiales bacterium (ex Bugula neritina AB1)]|nr:hypothetical protein AB833_02935 [Chromatiales bacterium (ex Bugula neritina AB1)]